jgi:hypothetical protein
MLAAAVFEGYSSAGQRCFTCCKIIECLNKALYSTLIIVACRAMMLHELFLYSQTFINRTANAVQ